MQIKAHRKDDHGDAAVLQPALNQKRRFIVEKSVPRRVLLEDELPRDSQRFRILDAEVRREAFCLDGDLGADARSFTRRPPSPCRWGAAVPRRESEG